MANISLILPLIILGILVAVMLVFIWWWFPRTYRKGMEIDMNEIAANERDVQAQRHEQVPPPYSATENGNQQSAPLPPTFEERVAYFKAQYERNGVEVARIA